jgi:hypothetical protein
MIEGTMKCYKCGKRSYDDNACLDEETGLLYRSDDEHYVVHHDDPSGPAWLEDGRNGLTPADIRWGGPELAGAAGLD